MPSFLRSRFQLWIFIGRTDVEAEARTLWPPNSKRQLTGKYYHVGKDGRAGREQGDRGWDGWIASLTQGTWFWANFGRQWRTGKPVVLQFMGTQRVGHDWATEQQKQKVPTTSPTLTPEKSGCVLSAPTLFLAGRQWCAVAGSHGPMRPVYEKVSTWSSVTSYW